MFDFLLTAHGFINFYMVLLVYFPITILTYIHIKPHIFDSELEKNIKENFIIATTFSSVGCILLFTLASMLKNVSGDDFKYAEHAYIAIAEMIPNLDSFGSWWLIFIFYAIFLVYLTYSYTLGLKDIKKEPNNSLKNSALLTSFLCLIGDYFLLILLFFTLSSPGTNIAVKYPILVSNQTTELIQECDQASLFPSSSVAKEMQNMQLIINAEACDRTDEKGKLAGEKARSVVADRLNAKNIYLDKKINRIKGNLQKDEKKMDELEATKNKLEHLIQQSNSN